MIFTKDLLLKGLAGLALCTGTAALGVHYMGGFSSLYKEVNITRVEDLGLTTSETCKLPEAGATTSCNLTAENINTIEFEGKNGNPTVTGSGTLATLQISIPRDNEKDIFPHGYKVTITATNNDITITRDASLGNIVLKTNQAIDFKIKQKKGKTFSLEKAWTAEELAKKAGLEKSDDHWTVGTKTIKVKHDSSTEPKTATSTQTGKIKAYADTSYNQGFKFVIEDGDINLGDGTITKLEQFETYEIKKESEVWVLVRKSKAIDEIKTFFGLPTEAGSCSESGGVTECALGDQTKLSAIKFEGKSDANVTVDGNDYSTIKLKISKTEDTNFTFGYKFVLESEKDITIPQAGSTSSSVIIKKGTNTEFKIKKTVAGENTTLTLEKAWAVGDLAAKAGLTECTTGNTKQCGFGSSLINVYDTASSYVTGASLANGSTGKKITYELDKEGHNQGIKFYIPHSETDNISITGGAATAAGVTAPTTISKETSAGGAPTYEIKEINGAWYLAKKSNVGG